MALLSMRRAPEVSLARIPYMTNFVTGILCQGIASVHGSGEVDMEVICSLNG